MFSLSSLVIFLSLPLIKIRSATFKIESIAPLVKIIFLPSYYCLVDIILRTESNGYSLIRGAIFSKLPLC